MQRPVLAHISALAAALVVIVLVSALWIVNLRMGPKLTGFTAGPMVIILPAMLLAVTAFWVIVRAILMRGSRPAAWVALVGGAAIAMIVVVAYCGLTACFVPGNERLLGWFAVGGTALATLVHQLVLGRFEEEAAYA